MQKNTDHSGVELQTVHFAQSLENESKFHFLKMTQLGAREIFKKQQFFSCMWLGEGNHDSIHTFTKLLEKQGNYT